MSSTTFNLTDAFRDTIEKEGLGEESLFTPAHPTGIDLFDYRNGRLELGEEKLGVDGGKVFTVIGKSGVGKSTLAIQMAGNIVKPYEHGQVIHLDYERATTRARIQQVTRWSDELIKQKYVLMNRKIYSETLYKMAKSIAEIKTKNFDALKIDTGLVDDKGKPVYTLPPTVILVDSWATMVPKDIADEEELSGSMAASGIAKTNNAIIKRIVGALEEANIILLIVNHITQKIEIGPVKTQAQLNYLKQDESIPGGTSCVYLANTLLKLQASSKLELDKDFGIKGFKAIGELIKSRSNEAGNKFTLVYSQQEGYHNVLTNLQMLKDLGLFKGNGRAYYFEVAPDEKFTQKNFVEKYNENPKLKTAFDGLVKEELAKFLSGVNTTELLGLEVEDYGEQLELVKHVEGDIWLASDGKHYHFNEDTEEITEVEA
jgi:RecA/RadA recombinase